MEENEQTLARVTHTHTHTSIRLINGDAYKEIKNIPDKSIDLIVIDPPYLVSNVGGGFFGENSTTYKGGKNTYTYGKRYVMKQINNFKDGIDETILTELCRVMNKINCYIWCSQKQIMQLIEFFVLKKKCNWNIIAWHKTDPIPACR